MKNNFFQKNKNILSIVGAILAFAAITLIYFNPVLQSEGTGTNLLVAGWFEDQEELP